MNYSINIWITVCLLGASTLLSSQQTIDLEKAIQIAQENSIEVKQVILQKESSKVQETEAKHSRYPSLSARGNYGISFGRTIDPTSNEFITEDISFNSWSASSSLTLFNGGRIHHVIQQSKINLASSEATLEQIKRDIALNVATAYLEVINAEDQLRNAENQLDLSNKQLERMQSLIDAGSQPQNALLDLEAQKLNDEQNVIIAENTLVISTLNLKRLLRLENEQVSIIRPEVQEGRWLAERIPDADQIYRRAKQIEKGILADSLNIVSSKIGEKIAVAGYYPTLSLSGNLSTNYSSEGRTLLGTETVFQQIPIMIGGEEVLVDFPTSQPLFGDSKYFDQLSNNFGYSVNLGLNIPIYSNYRNKANTQLAKIQTEQNRLEYERGLLNLRQNVITARAEAIAARKVYAAAKKTVESLQNAYENTEKRFNIGAANNYDLINAQNRLDNASINLINSRYDLLFKLKVIDYYMGKTLTIQ